MIQNPIFRTLGTFGMSVLLTASTWALSANTMNLSTYNTDTLPEGMYAKMSTNKGDIILKLHYDKKDIQFSVNDYLPFAQKFHDQGK